MEVFKIIVLLCSMIIAGSCEESSTKQPAVQNTTSHVEKEDDLTPVIEKPTDQKFARQIAGPEASSNTRSEVRYQGQSPSNPIPNTFSEPSANNQDQLQPTYLRSANPDFRQGRRFGSPDQSQPSYPEENQDSATRDLSRVPYHGRPATSVGQDYQGRPVADQTRSRVPYQGPSISDIDEQSYKPYSFNYIAETDEGRTSHQQTADSNGRVSGSYSMVLGDGRQRIVEYIADENGFRANVDTNEPGTSYAQSPANTVFYSSSPRPAIQGFQGSTTRVQPQPNLIPPARNDYRINNQRRPDPVSSPIRGSDDKIESQLNPSGPQLRRGRERVSETSDGNENVGQSGQNQIRPAQRTGRDDNVHNNRPENSNNPLPSRPVLISNRGNQNRQNDGLPVPNQLPSTQTYGTENRQRFQPVWNTAQSNARPALTGNDNLQTAPQLNGISQRQPFLDQPSPRTTAGSQYPGGQPVLVLPEEKNTLGDNERRSTFRTRGGNEPSYYGWFRPSVRSDSQNFNPDVRAQESPITRNLQPEEENISRYRPSQPDEATRSQRQPTLARPAVRSNVNDPSTNPLVVPTSERSPQTYSGRPIFINGINSDGNTQPGYNRAVTQNFDSRANSNVENTQDTSLRHQQNLPRRNTQPEGQNVFQNRRDETFVPENRAILDEIPPYFRDYGTYWFYGH